MNFFLDATLFLDCVDPKDKTRIGQAIKHADNDVGKHAFYTSLTVYGELLHIAMTENRWNELVSIRDFFSDISVKMLLPSIQLRKCCPCVDNATLHASHGRLNDHTHLAYFLAYQDELKLNHFVTNDVQFKKLPVMKCTACNGCGKPTPKNKIMINYKDFSRIINRK